MKIDVDAALRVWAEEGDMPYSARSRDYIWWDKTDEATEDDRAEALAALRAADNEAHEMNRALMRRAIEAAIGASCE